MYVPNDTIENIEINPPIFVFPFLNCINYKHFFLFLANHHCSCFAKILLNKYVCNVQSAKDICVPTQRR